MDPARFAVDAHAHLHPAHRIDRWLDAAFANLARLGGDGGVERALVIADPSGSGGFERLASAVMPRGVERASRAAGGDSALLLVRADERLHLVPGRQMATRERLEVLALGTTAALPDGFELAAAIAAARAAGALAVLPWAPGKWTGARGRLVAAVLAAAAPGDLLVADSSLRPRGWPLPPLLRRARRRGIALVAGSDPLPAAGEEAHVGRYGVTGAVSAAGDVASAVLGLLAGGAALPAGRRCGLARVLWRLARHRLGGAARAAASAR